MSDPDDERLAMSFRTMETVLATLRQAGRRPGSAERFVDFAARSWSSDLPISDQLVQSIQVAKLSRLRWRGAALVKDPFDLAIYPQLLAELGPRTVIELGAYEGGSAVWLSDTLATLGIDAQIYSFDIDLDRIRVHHPRVTFLRADLTDLQSLATPAFGPWQLRSLPHPWLVIEDAHVNTYAVLRYFDQHMRSGDYIVAEDLLDRAKYLEVRRFAIDHRYLIDTAWTDLFGYNATWNPNGYLRKA